MNRVLFALAIVAGLCGSAFANPPMAVGQNGYKVSDPLLTIGESVNGYTPVGVLDGLGAYRKNWRTVRVLANHELLNFRGNAWGVNDGLGGTLELLGARISYFDIDIFSRQIVDAGQAINTIYDANGNIASSTDVFGKPGVFGDGSFSGFSRFCAATLSERKQFWNKKYRRWGWLRFPIYYRTGLENRIFFTNEEDGGGFNKVGGAYWALDPDTGNIWQLPALGRGGWEALTELNTGDRNTVALLLSDDSSPFDTSGRAGGDAEDDDEAAPLYLYVGKKQRHGDFPARNGLRGGKLYVFVADNGDTSPADFNTAGTLKGKWVEINNTPVPAMASADGSTGYDLNGYPTQSRLWAEAEQLGAFGFSRPEDVATNPHDGTEAVLASTGVDTFVGGVDTFGTMYTVKTNFDNLCATLTIIYDGDADPTRALRSPDNLDWADNGYIYVQEDEAEEDTLEGEILFGPGAVNPHEAGIVKLSVWGATKRIMEIDRSVVLDPTTAGVPFDTDAGAAGEWESSGITDASKLFYQRPGTLFIFDVQAHGIEDQTDVNADSRINDEDLVEGGQLLFLQKNNNRRWWRW